jgi:hypothetical protein
MMILARCTSCPVAPGTACPGFHAPDLCRLAAGRPAYAGAIREHARQATAPIAPPTIRVDYGTPPDGPPRSRCCGQQ